MLQDDTISNCIEFTVNELIKSPDINYVIQKPCEQILVSIGRVHCKLVMDALIKHLAPHKIGHFMILETIGHLADVNMNEIIPYIKSTLGVISPILSLVKKEHEKIAYCYAIHRFCDAVMEYQSNAEKNSNHSILSNEPDVDLGESSSLESLNDSESIETDDVECLDVRQVKIKINVDINTEIGFIYDTIMHQWMNSRDMKLCGELLLGLSLMYPLLPVDKLLEESNKVILMLLNMYRRSIDRASVTSFLASVIKSINKYDPKRLDVHAQNTINTLFDYICVSPDYDKPATAKSHFEVLR